MAVAMAILLLGKSISVVQATSAPETFLIHVQHSQKQVVHAGMDPAASCFVPESKVEVCCSSNGKAEELGKGGFGVVMFFCMHADLTLFHLYVRFRCSFMGVCILSDAAGV